MRPSFAKFAALAATCLAAAPASGPTLAAPVGTGATLDAAYAISLAGLPVGNADVKSSFDGSKYRIQLQARLTGLAGMLTGGRSSAVASGAVAGGRVTPAAYAVTTRTSSENRSVRMGLQSGNVAAVEISPPLDDKPDRVPVESGHKRGVLDPVSALLMPATAKGDLTDPANCNRTLPVFDGASRFDVSLTFAGTRQVEKAGYSGTVLVCKARWRPISGHRPTRPAVKFMEDNEDLAVWLAPVEATRVLVPLRIEVRTMVGMSVVEAQRFVLGRETAMNRAALADE